LADTKRRRKEYRYLAYRQTANHLIRDMFGMESQLVGAWTGRDTGRTGTCGPKSAAGRGAAGSRGSTSGALTCRGCAGGFVVIRAANSRLGRYSRSFGAVPAPERLSAKSLPRQH
jgi:hypothetical protein